jgi:hypothetical protein
MGKSFNTGKLVNNLNVLDNGNVGIGVANPSTILDVVGAGGIRVNEDGAGTKVISIRSNFAGVDPAINVTTNNALLLQTNNTERMRITSSGNVGIGTSIPLVKFQITQPNGIGLPTLGTSTGGLFIAGDGNQYGLYIGNDGNTGNSWLQAMRNNTATPYNILLNPVGGNVGIGVTPATFDTIGPVLQMGRAIFYGYSNEAALGANFRYQGGDKYINSDFGCLYQMKNGTHVFSTAPSGTAGAAMTLSARMIITSGGNVLIGTATDNGFKLDVSGRMRANGITSSTGSVSSVYSGTAYGIINVTTRGIYYIFAQLPAGTGDVTNYTSMVIVLSDGSAAKIVANYSAPLLPLTLSGTLISVAQNSGALQPSIVWNFTSQN